MKNVFTSIFLFAALTSFAQYELDEEEEESKANLGIGIGIPYGGIGARLSFLPVKNLSLFAGGGYNLEGFGYSAGATVRLAPSKRVVPSLVAMYGYNSVIVVQGLEELNKTYFGPTVGAGMEIHKRNGQNFISIELLVPFRSQEFKDDMDFLRNSPEIEITDPWPVLFSFGYHMKFE